MRKFIAGVVVGFLVSCGIGFAATSFDHNGLFWNKLDTSAKTGYINGYGDAMQVSVGKLDSLNIAGELFHWKGSNKIIRQLSRELSTSGLSTDAAVKNLDSLYANPKYSELDLGQALQYLAARNGGDQSDLGDTTAGEPTVSRPAASDQPASPKPSTAAKLK